MALSMVRSLVDSRPSASQVLRDVDIPQSLFDRMLTGVPTLDRIFGGDDTPGIVPGEVILFTGGPGAGKSTMALQLADLYHQVAGRNVLYNCGEQAVSMVALAARRIGIAAGFRISQIENVDELIALVRELGVEVLFVDSLQMLRDSAEQSERQGLISAERKLLRLNAEGVTVFLIGHSTKGGKFAGPNTIKHDIDAHMELRLDPKTGKRIFELSKNRLGPANIQYEFSLSAAGLDFKPAQTDDEESPSVNLKQGRAETRRREIIDLARASLLDGVPLSGYSHEENFGLSCSGGFWRGMLKAAVEELRAEGYAVSERRISGRTHSVCLGPACADCGGGEDDHTARGCRCKPGCPCDLYSKKED